MAESYTYDPFGTPTIKNASGTIIATSALGNPLLFTGREWDGETALYFYRARYYKPAIGRFLSRDPLGYLPDANLYRYVGNNPTNRIDPYGAFVLWPGGAIALGGTDVVIDVIGVILGAAGGEIIIGAGIAIGIGILIGDAITRAFPAPSPNGRSPVPGPAGAGKCSGPLQGIEQPISWEVPLSPERANHILNGEGNGQGGHGPGRGIPGKSEFPSTLTDQEILDGIRAIANDPASYPGEVIPEGGFRIPISGTIRGVPTTVIVEPGGEGVITAWPEGVPRNPE